jgi:GNAT superfamily N-acetyltransferase
LIGRLAVAAVHQGRGLGALLLADAVQRAYVTASSIGSSMLIVNAIDERAAAFYETNGFVRLPDSLRLILPISAIGKLLMS